MTAICFLVDERLFNKEIFVSYEKFSELYFRDNPELSQMDYIEFLNDKIPNNTVYQEWVKYIGGVKNETIYNIINRRKLAS